MTPLPLSLPRFSLPRKPKVMTIILVWYVVRTCWTMTKESSVSMPIRRLRFPKLSSIRFGNTTESCRIRDQSDAYFTIYVNRRNFWRDKTTSFIAKIRSFPLDFCGEESGTVDVR